MHNTINTSNTVGRKRKASEAFADASSEHCSADNVVPSKYEVVPPRPRDLAAAKWDDDALVVLCSCEFERLLRTPTAASFQNALNFAHSLGVRSCIGKMPLDTAARYDDLDCAIELWAGAAITDWVDYSSEERVMRGLFEVLMQTGSIISEVRRRLHMPRCKNAEPAPTLLARACAGGSLVACQLLLDNGADVDRPRIDSYIATDFPLTALIRRYGRDPKLTSEARLIATWIVKASADLNQPSLNGETALMAAVRLNSREFVSMLLSRLPEVDLCPRYNALATKELVGSSVLELPQTRDRIGPVGAYVRVARKWMERHVFDVRDLVHSEDGLKDLLPIEVVRLILSHLEPPKARRVYSLDSLKAIQAECESAEPLSMDDAVKDSFVFDIDTSGSVPVLHFAICNLVFKVTAASFHARHCVCCTDELIDDIVWRA